jgi:hypothetical protein
MWLVSIGAWSPYITIIEVEDTHEAELRADSNSQWILLTDKQMKKFLKVIYKKFNCDL